MTLEATEIITSISKQKEILWKNIPYQTKEEQKFWSDLNYAEAFYRSYELIDEDIIKRGKVENFEDIASVVARNPMYYMLLAYEGIIMDLYTAYLYDYNNKELLVHELYYHRVVLFLEMRRLEDEGKQSKISKKIEFLELNLQYFAGEINAILISLRSPNPS